MGIKSYSFRLFLLPNLLFALLFLHNLDHSNGCTPNSSGCCAAPRQNCGSLPPCSPGSMSASHLSR
jgi:hypothetical protein